MCIFSDTCICFLLLIIYHLYNVYTCFENMLLSLYITLKLFIQLTVIEIWCFPPFSFTEMDLARMKHYYKHDISEQWQFSQVHMTNGSRDIQFCPYIAPVYPSWSKKAFLLLKWVLFVWITIRNMLLNFWIKWRVSQVLTTSGSLDKPCCPFSPFLPFFAPKSHFSCSNGSCLYQILP